MCGIVGYAGFTKRVLLDQAIAAIRHRGPDDSGTEYFSGIALGNTRLSIIDLSPRGHQPMYSRDKTLCITFNGEIYNYREIRSLLEKKYPFFSNTDTEVILYSYREWGKRCVEKLHGMFSFVIFDRKKQLLFGARDRLGQKPLKYYYKDGQFVFASEIKGILPLLDEKPGLDTVAIDDFLTLQYIPAPKTGFKNICKLPPAHYFIYKDGKLAINRYWSLDFQKKRALGRQDWQDLIFFEMERVVKSHLVADVPVGVLLSGGIDSSLVAALMARNSSRPIYTFTIGFDDERFDETKYAAMVSQMYRTHHTQLDVSSAALRRNIGSLVSCFDEPIGDNSILPTMLVSKLTRKKVKVALTGDGGDENFAGYDRYVFVNLSWRLSRLPPFAKEAFRRGAEGLFRLYPNKQTERVTRFFYSLEDVFYRKYLQYNCFFTTRVKHNLYRKDFEEGVNQNDTFELFRDLYNRHLSDLDNALKIDCNTYLPDDLLYKSDSASMANSLELRAPFLDHEFMETMAAMPSTLKIAGVNKKAIVKEIALRKQLLPGSVINRPKHGFVAPLNRWFKGPLKRSVTEIILSSRMCRKIFDKPKLEQYVAAYYQTNLNYDNTMFALFMLSLWLDRYQL